MKQMEKKLPQYLLMEIQNMPTLQAGLHAYWQPMTMVSPGRQSQCNMMEQKLLAHSQQHFSQAQGTAYMQEPLQTLLNYDGLTKFADQVFQGKLPTKLNVPPVTQLLLEHQKSLLQPNEDTSHPLTFEGLMAGFKKWLEKTATSPSGQHLGIYKSMSKDS